MSQPKYLDLLSTRPVVFDGAMGTSIQSRSPSEEDFGGPSLEGCNDHLVLSAPHIVRDIHASFLEVGCDAVETNTFRANRFALAEYDLQGKVTEINETAASIAKEVASSYTRQGRPRFVAGSIGPSGFLPSSSDPELGAATFEELTLGFEEQARALLRGGADILLVETGQDILEVKAAVFGVRRAMAGEGRRVPLQAQVTLDTSGRMLLGTDMESAMVTLEALRVDVLGLNCSTGPEPMRGPLRVLSEQGRTPISVIPNAGIPENIGGEAVYPLTPGELARTLEEFVQGLGVAVVGGCCGTTPEHIRAVVEALDGVEIGERPSGKSPPRISSAIQAVDLQQVPAPTLVGERINAQGSRRVKELLLREDYEGILQVARQQVEGGAHILDVSVALTERGDEAAQMRTLVKLLSQGVEAPIMVDTTEAEVVEAALRQLPGRAVINSVHLEGGREKLDRTLALAVEHGAAVVALTIDESGMAKTADEKISVARRIRDISTEEYGLEPSDLIFDALTFTLATGEEEYRRSAIETLSAIGGIKKELPGCLTSLGISNVSFGLQPEARSVLNSTFLHHAVEAGLDMAILNPAHITPFDEIDQEPRGLAEDLLHFRRSDALARFLSYFQGRTTREPETASDPRESMAAPEAIRWMILHRKKDKIEAWVDEAISFLGGGHDGAVRTLNEVLLPAMKEVGDRFGAGDLILPFVLQSAEVMKLAVSRLEGSLERIQGQSKGTVVLATVLGDVHDIGKNLVHTILENNGYTVHNLGKQVPVNTVLEKAQELAADAIGLSALLVSTSKQMPLLVQELDRRGLEYPVLLGGAAINPSFVREAAKVDDTGTLHSSGVFYCKDAFDGLAAMDALMDPAGRDGYLRAWAEESRKRDARRRELVLEAPKKGPRERRPPPSRRVAIPEPPFWGARVLDEIALDGLFPLVDRNTLYRLHWGAKNAKDDVFESLVKMEFEPRLLEFQQDALSGGWIEVRGAYGYFPAAAADNDLVIFDPEDPRTELGRFDFPRQAARDRLCLSDFFRPLASESAGPEDTVALQVVTVASPRLERAVESLPEGEYSETYFLHGFGVRLAEAGAEYLHRRIRWELGIGPERGLRYSWGYGACPDPLQHELVFDLLPAREALNMSLTEAGSLIPELSTAALVVHHPEARYFSV